MPKIMCTGSAERRAPAQRATPSASVVRPLSYRYPISKISLATRSRLPAMTHRICRISRGRDPGRDADRNNGADREPGNPTTHASRDRTNQHNSGDRPPTPGDLALWVRVWGVYRRTAILRLVVGQAAKQNTLGSSLPTAVPPIHSPNPQFRACQPQPRHP